MPEYLDILRWLHVIGACVLLGTGAGIAFFMLVSCRERDPGQIAHVAGIVVLADAVFTATAVILQPITGVLLARVLGWPLDTPWIIWSLLFYGVTGAFWLPVVWIQIKLRDLARVAASQNAPLPDQFIRLYRIWVACGFPAFLAVLSILWLMLTRPDMSAVL